MASYPRPGGGRDYGFSGLEVVNDHAHHAPEVVQSHQSYQPYQPHQAEKEAIPAYTGNPQYLTGQYPAEKQYPTSARSKRRICGIKRSIFWILVAVLGLILVAAAVGGAVAGSQSSSKSSSAPATTTVTAAGTATASAPSSSSTSPTSTTTKSSSSTTSTASKSATATPIGEGEGTYTCPESDEKDYTTPSGTGGARFKQVCDVDWPVGITAHSGSATDDVEDLGNVLQYSLQDCIDQCAAYSLSNSPGCTAVTYAANITRAQDRGYGGNCWLKTARGAKDSVDTSRQVQSAYRIGD